MTKQAKKTIENDGQYNEFLTPNGQNFLRQKLLPVLEKHREELLSSASGQTGKTADEAQKGSRDRLEVIQNQITDCKKKLLLPIRPVAEQNNYFLPGNGGKVKIGGERNYVVMDGVCVCKHKLPPNHKIIGADSPLGKALLGKRVGESVNFSINGSGQQTAIIESIDLPSKSKWVFKYDNITGQLEEMAKVETAVV